MSEPSRPQLSLETILPIVAGRRVRLFRPSSDAGVNAAVDTAEREFVSELMQAPKTTDTDQLKSTAPYAEALKSLLVSEHGEGTNYDTPIRNYLKIVTNLVRNREARTSHPQRAGAGFSGSYRE